MRKLVLAFLFFSVMAFSQTQSEPDKLAPLLKAAQSLIQNSQFDSADKVLQTAIAAAQKQSATKWLAVLQNEYGLLKARQGDYLLAVEQLRSSQHHYLDAADHAAAAAVERNLGLQYQRLGLLDMAAIHLRSSIASLQKQQLACAAAFSQLEYGTTLTLLNRYDEAEQVLQTAQTTLKSCPEQVLNYAGSFDRLANLYRQQGHFEKAADHYRMAQQHTPSQAKRSRGHLLTNLAQLALDQQNWQQAASYSQQALLAFRSDHASDDLLHTQNLQAQAAFHQSQYAKAASLAEKALNQLDALYERQGGSQPARSFLHYRETLLATYLAAQLEQALHTDNASGHIIKALRAYERFRSRALKRARSAAKANAVASQNAIYKIHQYASKLEKANAENYHSTLETLHRELRQQQMQQAKQLRNTEDTSSFSLESLQQHLAETKAVALVYVLGPPGHAKTTDKHGYLIAIGATQLWAYRIKGDLPDQARHYRAQIMRCNPSQKGLLRYLADNLYQKLLAPVLQQTTAEKLYILADSHMQLLPFDTLIQNATPSKAITIVYPAALSLIAKDAIQFDAKARVVFGNPRYTNGKQHNQHPDWPTLKHGFWDADEALLRTDSDANRPAFLKAMQASSSILHASAHATIQDRVPELSALVLATYDAQGHAIAGEIYAYEIEQQNCNAPLVVLAACRTADGHWYKGEGIWGLSHAFLAAGSQSVLVSLWDVDDQATSLLMRAFYQALETGQPPSRALVHAKQRLQQHPVYQHPGYWAAFVLHGDLKFKK